MSEIMPETLVDVLTIILAIGVVLGLLLSHLDLRAKIQETADDRNAIIFGEAVAGSPCFTLKENGNLKKGVFDSKKLENPPCLPEYPRPYRITVVGGDRYWVFSTGEPSGVAKTFPVAVRIGDKTVPGWIEVVV